MCLGCLLAEDVAFSVLPPCLIYVKVTFPDLAWPWSLHGVSVSKPPASFFSSQTALQAGRVISRNIKSRCACDKTSGLRFILQYILIN